MTEKKIRPQTRHLIPGKGRTPFLPPLKRKVKKTVWLSGETLQLVHNFQRLLAESGESKRKCVILREAVECGLKVMAGNLLAR